jgi:hypothetical protein
MGITVVPIPFWWNKSPGSLAATVQAIRPDLQLSSSESAIPLSMPLRAQSFRYTPISSKKYAEQIDPTGWLLMEKYDGVRVYWDGKQLYRSSSKIVIDVPSRYSLPSIPFEGELW